MGIREARADLQIEMNEDLLSATTTLLLHWGDFARRPWLRTGPLISR
jgi:hypothetical protein